VKPVHQTTFAARSGEGAGNCLAAAIATLLELPLEDVPNFSAIEGTKLDLPSEHKAEEDGSDMAWFKAVEDFLAARDLAVVVWEWKHSPYVQPGTPALLHGKSPRGDFLHTVVAIADSERWVYVHDPHPDGTFIVGDPVEGWVVVPVSIIRGVPAQKGSAT
jgi:hypothetical protein